MVDSYLFVGEFLIRGLYLFEEIFIFINKLVGYGEEIIG